MLADSLASASQLATSVLKGHSRERSQDLREMKHEVKLADILTFKNLYEHQTIRIKTNYSAAFSLLMAEHVT